MTLSANSASTSKTPSTRSAVVVLLAGGLREAPIRQQLGVPVLGLPLSARYTMLDRWIDAVDAAPSCRSLKIVVSNDEDAQYLRSLVHNRIQHDGPPRVEANIIVDAANWRGPGGLVRDVSQAWSDDRQRLTLVAEAACLPPGNIEDIIQSVNPATPGLSGASATGDPAGLHVFTHEAIRLIPSVGFFDIKEQLLPALYARGTPMPVMQVVDQVMRIRDRVSYLNCVHTITSAEGDDACCHAASEVDETAHVAGRCIIHQGAVIGGGAVIHDSIILHNAVIGGSAVVSQSVIGPGVHLRPHASVKQQVIANTARRLERRQGLHRLLGFTSRAKERVS